MKLTPTQQRIHDLLMDGEAHTREELRECLWDELNTDPDNAVAVHVSTMRRELNSRGLDIVCRGRNGTATFRMLRFISRKE